MTKPDYSKLLDTEMQAFVARTEAFYEGLPATAGWDDLRVAYDRMCADFRAARPPGLSVIDTNIAGVRVRIYEPAAPKPPTLLYLHGGGFVMGGIETHDDVCAELAAATGLRTVAVDYRLAPEAPLPAAFDDGLLVGVSCASTYPGGLIVAGDSAGGCLAAALSAAWVQAGPEVLGQVLIYPGLGWSLDTPSAKEHANAPLLTRSDLGLYADLLPAEARDRERITPLNSANQASLPPSLAISADCDPLRDDSRDYVAAIQAAGGEAVWVNVPGLVHGALRARHMSSRAREMFQLVTDSISAMADPDAGFGLVKEICAARTY